MEEKKMMFWWEKGEMGGKETEYTKGGRYGEGQRRRGEEKGKGVGTEETGRGRGERDVGEEEEGEKG